jgi:uncharacterized membrane protein YphA (DoxX/SURF4 family)
MTLGTLVLIVAIAAVLLTVLIGIFFKDDMNTWIVSLLQNFCGVLFIFSGWVKAVDPLGTAYKMEQYFAEFQGTFEDTTLSFMAPLFPTLSEYAIGFSVGMIVFEIILGLMLLLGSWPKVTAWAFFLLVLFFTFLTGFTYLTGYVPEGVNFFQFGKWGPYVETNMKVTDCGCFGDFIKLEPKTSFLKDIFLLVPSLIFLFFHKSMHQVLSVSVRRGIIWVTLAGLIIYCLSNYSWDLPHTDFRPFKEGVNLAEQKAMQDEAISNITVTAYKLTNKETGKVVEIPFDQYLKEYKNYSDKEVWESEQIKSEPDIPINKISEFDVSDADGYGVTEDILAEPGYSFMIVAHKLYGTTSSQEIILRDTIFELDTLQSGDELIVERKIADIQESPSMVEVYNWKENYVQLWTEKVNPIMEAALQQGAKVYGITGPATSSKIKSFRETIQADYPVYTADDILLKTIIRSNPGVVLLHNGKILKKWHIKKLPEDFEEIQAKYMK